MPSFSQYFRKFMYPQASLYPGPEPFASAEPERQKNPVVPVIAGLGNDIQVIEAAIIGRIKIRRDVGKLNISSDFFNAAHFSKPPSTQSSLRSTQVFSRLRSLLLYSHLCPTVSNCPVLASRSTPILFDFQGAAVRLVCAYSISLRNYIQLTILLNITQLYCSKYIVAQRDGRGIIMVGGDTHRKA